MSKLTTLHFMLQHNKQQSIPPLEHYNWSHIQCKEQIEVECGCRTTLHILALAQGFHNHVTPPFQNVIKIICSGFNPNNSELSTRARQTAASLLQGQIHCWDINYALFSITPMASPPHTDHNQQKRERKRTRSYSYKQSKKKSKNHKTPHLSRYPKIKHHHKSTY